MTTTFPTAEIPLGFPPLHPIYHDYTHALDLSFTHQDDSLRHALMEIRDTIVEYGDDGVRMLTCRYDRVRDAQFPLWVTPEEIEDAYTRVSAAFLAAIRDARDNITEYHRHQLPQNWEATPREGVRYGAMFHPLDRVALYVPGGRARYPSSVLMNAIPAMIAGVPDCVIATPPDADGSVPPEILVAAAECGVSRILRSGGAQAVFALAYGTPSIPVVDKIVGPGNKYVDGAKQMVFGRVAIDKPAGPSEVVVYLDREEWTDFAAMEILSQLEHDPDASAFLVAPSEQLLRATQSAVLRLAVDRDRVDILKESLKNFYCIVTSTNADTLKTLNGLAGEHLVLLTSDAREMLPQIRHAGSVFLGPYSPVALGDYAAGPNHVLPTARAARFASPLGVMDFMKYTSHLEYSEAALQNLAQTVTTLARVEGFEAHAHSVDVRLLEG
jgi:histidinol dehydrogenase